MLWSISGGAGFLGLHLARRLLADGHEVRTLDVVPLDDAELERTVEEFIQMKFPAEWRRLNAVQAGRVYAVNGSAYFNRPGPRIVGGLKILAEVIHPEVFPRTTPPEAWRRLG